MVDPAEPLITREACALYFATRSVAHAALCCSLSALLLILIHLYKGAGWDHTAGSALFAAQIHLFVLPVVLLVGLHTGESLWRNCYLPDAARYIQRVIFWTRAAFAALGFAMLIFLRGIPPIVIILATFFGWLIMELYLQRAKRAAILQIAPGMRTLGSIAVLSALLQGWVISSVSGQSPDEGQFIFQQMMVLGCLIIYELNDTVNIMWKWKKQGRLPLHGNNRFQIQLSTILLIVCGLGLWATLLKWTFF